MFIHLQDIITLPILIVARISLNVLNDNNFYKNYKQCFIKFYNSITINYILHN
jgi:hypothetical protein